MGKFVFLAALLLSVVSGAAHRQILLTGQNTVTIRGVIDAPSVHAAMNQLNALDKKRGIANYSLYLVLDTPGGEIEEGEALIQYAKTLRNVHTITIFAASMGSAIVEALPGKRLIAENGTLMFHRAAVGLSGQIGDGEVESRLAYFKEVVNRMEIRNSDRMSMPLAEYKRRVKDEMWLTSDQSLKEHAADDMVDIKCSQSLIESSEIKVMQIMIFTIKLKFSGCPLFRVPEMAQKGEEAQNLFNQLRPIMATQFSPGVF